MTTTYSFDKETNRFEIMEGFYLTDNQIIAMAEEVAASRLIGTDAITSPQEVKTYIKAYLQFKEREHFFVIFLNNQHKVIAHEDMFQGTIDSASVYPREVVKRALQLNAAAIILAHNHPSGDPTPSQADRRITFKIKDALELVDVKVLDHIVVGVADTYVFSEHGIL